MHKSQGPRPRSCRDRDVVSDYCTCTIYGFPSIRLQFYFPVSLSSRLLVVTDSSVHHPYTNFQLSKTPLLFHHQHNDILTNPTHQAAVLIASPNPASLGDFYTHLTTRASDTRFSAPNNQPLLSVRLRDVLLKLVTLVGAPPVVVGVSALAKAEAGAKGKEGVEKASQGSIMSEKWYVLDFLMQLWHSTWT